MKSLHIFIVYIICIQNYSLYSSDRLSSRSKSNYPKFTVEYLHIHNSEDVHKTCQILNCPTIRYKIGLKDNILTTTNLIDEIQYTQNKYLICKAHNNICGILNYEEDFNDQSAEYKMLAIHPNYQRQGIGSFLMKIAEKNMHHKIHAIHLNVQPNNINAIACYKKNGFKIIPCTQCVNTCLLSLYTLLPCVDASIFAIGMVKSRQLR